MIMLKSTHEKVVANFERVVAITETELMESEKTIDSLIDEAKELQEQMKECKEYAEELQNTNAELSTKLSVLDSKLSTSIKMLNLKETENKELQEDILDSATTIKEFMDKIKSLEKEIVTCKEEAEKKVEEYRLANVAMGQIYNNINRKLWCNEESQRQLKNLAIDILEVDKVNKVYVSKYLQEIAVRLCGGEDYKFVSVDKE